MVGCTLEDCLKQFIVAEQVENYNCGHCWHVAAIKYLSLRGAKEVIPSFTQSIFISIFKSQPAGTCAVDLLRGQF